MQLVEPIGSGVIKRLVDGLIYLHGDDEVVEFGNQVKPHKIALTIRRGQLGMFCALALNLSDDAIIIPEGHRRHDGGKLWGEPETPRYQIVVQMVDTLENLMGLCAAEDGSVCVHPEVLHELGDYREWLLAYMRRMGGGPNTSAAVVTDE